MPRQDGAPDMGEMRKRSRTEVRFDPKPAEDDGNRTDSEEDNDSEEQAEEPAVGPKDLRYLMKRPSYGDILQTLQPTSDQMEGMSAIIAAARHQQEAVAAAMANPQNPLHHQMLAAHAAASGQQVPPGFYGVQYQSPVMMAQPQHVAPRLGKHEEHELAKKERRLLKNREAAKECRRKKKEFVKGMEDRIRALEQHATMLAVENNKLRVRMGLPEIPHQLPGDIDGMPSPHSSGPGQQSPS